MSNKGLIQKMYADFQIGNVPEILNAMSEDVHIHTPGPESISWAGKYEGKSGALTFFQNVGSSTEYSRFELQDLIEEGDKVVARGSADFTSRATNKSGSADWIMIWTIKEHKASAVTNLWDTQAIVNTL